MENINNDFNVQIDENAVLNIGMHTKDGKPLNIHKAIKHIGKMVQNCTIIECHGFYKGEYEPSLKVEIYDIKRLKVQLLASYFAWVFNQECVAWKCEGDNFTHFETDEHYLILKENDITA